MVCKHCGATLEDGVKFCVECGAKIEEVVEATTGSEVTASEPERVDAEIVDDGAPRMSFDGDEEATASQTGPAERVQDSSETRGHSSEGGTFSGVGANSQGPIGYSIASLVCGILSILCCCCGFFGFVLSAAAIGLGIFSLNKNCEGKGFAIAGIACGGTGLLFMIIGVIVGAATGSIGDSLDGLTDIIDSF